MSCPDCQRRARAEAVETALGGSDKEWIVERFYCGSGSMADNKMQERLNILAGARFTVFQIVSSPADMAHMYIFAWRYKA